MNGWSLSDGDLVHENNLRQENLITQAEFLEERIRMGAVIHKYCDPNYMNRMKALNKICAEVGIV
jgi:hypothetical protein